jgi:hypothetical protein
MPRYVSKLARMTLAALPRAWWTFLLVIHLPILVAICSALVTEGLGVSRLGSLLALVVAMAFFFLKLRDVPYLRLRTRQQSIIVVGLLTALVHSNAIAPGVDGTVVAQTTVALVATRTAHQWLRQRPRIGPGILARLLATLTPRPLTLAVAAPRDRAVVLLPQWVLPSLSVPRAPPA